METWLYLKVVDEKRKKKTRPGFALLSDSTSQQTLIKFVAPSEIPGYVRMSPVLAADRKGGMKDANLHQGWGG